MMERISLILSGRVAGATTPAAPTSTASRSTATNLEKLSICRLITLNVIWASGEPLYLDIHVPAGAEFSTALPDSHNAFIYVYRGAVTVDGVQVASRRMGILGNPGSLGNAPGVDSVTLSAAEDARLILVAGILDAVTPPAHTTLMSGRHPALWWGMLMVVVGGSAR
jgi:redox-sensitive bicupin YhaK (pirin superfamily)